MVTIGSSAPSAYAQTLTFFFHAEAASAGPNSCLMKNAVPDAPSNTATTIAANSVTIHQVNCGGADIDTGATTHPAQQPPVPQGWWSDSALSGTFAPGNWTFFLRESDNKQDVQGHWFVSVYQCKSNTDVNRCVLMLQIDDPATTRWTASTTTAAISRVMAGSFTLSGEYLLVNIYMHVTTVSKPDGTMLFATEGNELPAAALPRMTTPDFTVGMTTTTATQTVMTPTTVVLSTTAVQTVTTTSAATTTQTVATTLPISVTTVTAGSTTTRSLIIVTTPWETTQSMTGSVRSLTTYTTFSSTYIIGIVIENQNGVSKTLTTMIVGNTPIPGFATESIVGGILLSVVVMLVRRRV